MKSETIVAIATAMSHAGIGIIRISGEEALSIVDKIYRSKNKDKLISKQKTHTMHYGTIVDGKDVIDEVLVSVMKAPASYTKEDVVEINCHGGVVVTRRILELVMKYGARLAEPGEFTKRAFLNGRMDLSEAEAVSSLILSKNEYALRNSVKQLKGGLSKKIRGIREKILKDMAFIEAALDDPEHYDVNGFGRELKRNVEEMEEEVGRWLDRSENGRFLVEGIGTIIVGKPNVGKSSLLNVLLGEERAIVTDVEGTTRDSLEETIRLDGIVLNVIDTAGIRHTKDKVEKIGIQRTLEKMEEADFVIYVMDASLPMDENDQSIIEKIRDKKGVVLFNKSDLNVVIEEEDVKRLMDKRIIRVSTKTEEGIHELKEYVKNEFFQGSIAFDDEIFITNVRHKECMMEAMESFLRVKESIDGNLPEDFYTIDLMNAYQSLGRILGENVEEDLIDQIFKDFCMGK